MNAPLLPTSYTVPQLESLLQRKLSLDSVTSHKIALQLDRQDHGGEDGVVHVSDTLSEQYLATLIQTTTTSTPSTSRWKDPKALAAAIYPYIHDNHVSSNEGESFFRKPFERTELASLIENRAGQEGVKIGASTANRITGALEATEPAINPLVRLTRSTELGSGTISPRHHNNNSWMVYRPLIEQLRSDLPPSKIDMLAKVVGRALDRSSPMMEQNRAPKTEDTNTHEPTVVLAGMGQTDIPAWLEQYAAISELCFSGSNNGPSDEYTLLEYYRRFLMGKTKSESISIMLRDANVALDVLFDWVKVNLKNDNSTYAARMRTIVTPMLESTQTFYENKSIPEAERLSRIMQLLKVIKQVLEQQYNGRLGLGSLTNVTGLATIDGNNYSGPRASYLFVMRAYNINNPALMRRVIETMSGSVRGVGLAFQQTGRVVGTGIQSAGTYVSTQFEALPGWGKGVVIVGAATAVVGGAIVVFSDSNDEKKEDRKNPAR